MEEGQSLAWGVEEVDQTQGEVEEVGALRQVGVEVAEAQEPSPEEEAVEEEVDQRCQVMEVGEG